MECDVTKGDSIMYRHSKIDDVYYDDDVVQRALRLTTTLTVAVLMTKQTFDHDKPI